MSPAPSVSTLFTQWTVAPLAIVATAALAGWYWRAARRVPSWPRGRAGLFALGLALVLWTTCGFPGAYVPSLFWVWTAQQLALLLVIPFVLLSGAPLRLVASTSPVGRFLRSTVARLLANPLVGPAVVPLLSVVLFFGPLPRWCVDIALVGWLEQLLVLAVGALIVLPFASDEMPSSLRVGLALAIGSFELVLDSVPGIALRLHNSLSTSYFDVRSAQSWSPSPLHDQQLAGAILWCVAELIDLPFLVLVFRQWVRADARDAAQVDAVLEAERASLSLEGDADRDQPWWLNDQSWRQR